MGKYDIYAKFPYEERMSLNDLLIELDNEYGHYDLLTYRDKFKNSDRSGIIDKLKDLLHFDIEAMAKKSDIEKFETLKLLKELFLIEKYGLPKNTKYVSEKDTRIRITDILAKPRMANIVTYLSGESKYRAIFEKLYEDIKDNVDDAEQRIDLVDKVDAQWQYIVQKQFDYVTSDMALSDSDSALKELKRINQKLDSIISEFEPESETDAIPKEGVMKTFFNLLLNHKQLCYLTDRISMETFLVPPQNPDDKFVSLFKKYESQVILVDKIPVLKKALKAKDNPEIMKDLLNLLSYFEEIPESDYKHYNYAFEHCGIVLRWLMKEKDGVDFSHEVPMSVFVSVIQEIVYIKKNINDFKIRIDYYGYKASKVSLLSALKKQADDEAASVLLDIWNRRIENRFCANFGAIDLIAEKNKADIKTLVIRKHIFSHIDLNCLKAENDSLLHKVVVAHTNTSVATAMEARFRNILSYRLGTLDVIVDHFEFPEDSNTIYDMFRELLYAYGEGIDDKLEEIAKSVTHIIMNKELYECNDSCISEMECKFIINYPNGTNQNCSLCFNYDSKEKLFLYKKFILK